MNDVKDLGYLAPVLCALPGTITFEGRAVRVLDINLPIEQFRPQWTARMEDSRDEVFVHSRDHKWAEPSRGCTLSDGGAALAAARAALPQERGRFGRILVTSSYIMPIASSGALTYAFHPVAPRSTFLYPMFDGLERHLRPLGRTLHEGDACRAWVAPRFRDRLTAHERMSMQPLFRAIDREEPLSARIENSKIQSVKLVRRGAFVVVTTTTNGGMDDWSLLGAVCLDETAAKIAA